MKEKKYLLSTPGQYLKCLALSLLVPCGAQNPLPLILKQNKNTGVEFIFRMALNRLKTDE